MPGSMRRQARVLDGASLRRHLLSARRGLRKNTRPGRRIVPICNSQVGEGGGGCGSAATRRPPKPSQKGWTWRCPRAWSGHTMPRPLKRGPHEPRLTEALGGTDRDRSGSVARRPSVSAIARAAWGGLSFDASAPSLCSLCSPMSHSVSSCSSSSPVIVLVLWFVPRCVHVQGPPLLLMSS